MKMATPKAAALLSTENPQSFGIYTITTAYFNEEIGCCDDKEKPLQVVACRGLGD